MIATKHNWTEIELEKLRKDYPHRKTDNLAAEMGLTYRQVCGMAYKLKLKKTDVFLKSPECNRLDGVKGASTRFVKGQAAHNKGVTMSPELREKVKHTWFPIGHEPKNTKYDGYERISKDGYREIRISKGKFEPLHRHNWEQVNGPIPEDKILRSKDGDPANCDPANWRLIEPCRASKREFGSRRIDRQLHPVTTHAPGPRIKAGTQRTARINRIKTKSIKIKENNQ